jgi:poly-gamma-glutamate capsule biosynthesis protein CapA/YwtB (metallophosphatase superfamily)
MKNTFLILTVLTLTLQASAKEFISVTAVGDIMMGTNFPTNMLPANNGQDMFKAALPWIAASDIRFGNFEGTFFEGEPQPDGKQPGPNKYMFKTPLAYVSHLQEAQFNVMSLANNHIRDFGSAGIQTTKDTLKQAGIQYSSKAGEVAQFKVDDTEISLIAMDYYQGRRSITQPERTYQEIKNLKQKRNIVIVSIHAGGEGSAAVTIPVGPEMFLGENRGDSIAFARAAVEAGADLVIMHGPHVPRAIELYKNRLIAYSLGNFMTGQGVSIGGVAGQAPLLRVEMDHSGQFRQGQIVSFMQQRSPQRVVIDTKHRAMLTIKDMSAHQFPDSPLVFEKDGLFK